MLLVSEETFILPVNSFMYFISYLSNRKWQGALQTFSVKHAIIGIRKKTLASCQCLCIEPLNLPKSCSPRLCQLLVCLAAQLRSCCKLIFPPYTLSILLWPRVSPAATEKKWADGVRDKTCVVEANLCSPVACWLTSAACRTDWVLKLGAVERCCICCLVRVNIMVCWPGVALRLCFVTEERTRWTHLSTPQYSLQP